MLTLQEIFTKSVTHLLTQNEKASFFEDEDAESCRYLMDDGRQCGIGCLIPKDLYDPEIEGLAIGNAWNFDSEDKRQRRFAKLRKILFESGISINTPQLQPLLGELQETHDSISVGQWNVTLREIGERYGLKFPDGFENPFEVPKGWDSV